MKLTKETLKRIIKEELNSLLNEEESSDKSVLDFFITLRKNSSYWTRDASNYAGHQVDGFSYFRNIPKRTTSYKMTNGDRIQNEDWTQVLREYTTVVEVPGVQIHGSSIIGTEGKYAIKLLVVAKDAGKSRNRAFNNMGNQSHLPPIVSDMQEFPQDGVGFAKTIMEKEKKFFEEVTNEEFRQSIEKSSRSEILEAFIQLATKVYGINFKEI